LSETATALIQFSQVTRSYTMGDQVLKALDCIDLCIDRNEYVAITGPSGSGKTTLMNIIGCLDRPSSGEFYLNQANVGEQNDGELARIRNREIGFIFQSFNLLPRATALKNVMQPLVYRKLPRSERQARAMESLERVGLGDRVHHLPNELSGGQRQRVAVARALVGTPAILLADEPTGNLDSVTSREILALFDELHKEGQTIIMVTHEPDIAAHCHRELRLLDGKISGDSKKAGADAPSLAES
jgi:putative ABC transport system ATP-binding protein